MRVGVFGGSFNPPHLGHIQSMETVLKLCSLEKVLAVPNSQNPLKQPVDGATVDHRLNMLKLAMVGFDSRLVVDDREIQRGGKSYTIDTIKSLQKENPEDDIHLIMGLDQFEVFHDWREWDQILNIANLIVTTRPGFDLPYEQEDLPGWLTPLIAEYDRSYIQLRSGKSILFVRLNDLDISSSDLRKAFRSGRVQHKHLPLAVEKYILENKLYLPLGDRIGDYKQFTEFCADVLFGKKGIQVKGFDFDGLGTPMDFALICSGTSTRHASGMGENVIHAVKDEFGVYPLSAEGLGEGRWVLLDYGGLILHIFYDYVRNEYNLEGLWGKAKKMDLVDPVMRGKAK